MTVKKGQDVWCRPTAFTTFPYSHRGAQREQPSRSARLSMETPRRKLQPIKVYCSVEERREIEQLANRAGVSTSEYLRTIGLNFPLKSRVDLQAVKTLSKLNADLGRAGGLLKMLLKNDEKFFGYTGKQLKELSLTAVKELAEIGTELRHVCQNLLRK